MQKDDTLFNCAIRGWLGAYDLLVNNSICWRSTYNHNINKKLRDTFLSED